MMLVEVHDMRYKEDLQKKKTLNKIINIPMKNQV